MKQQCKLRLLVSVGLLSILSLANCLASPQEETVAQQQGVFTAASSTEDSAAMDPATIKSTGSVRSRLFRVERQVTNIVSMHLSQQIDELRQEVERLNGQLQEQQHALSVLASQQRGFYQDVTRRIQQVVDLSVAAKEREHAQVASAAHPSGRVGLSSAQAKASPARGGDALAYRTAFTHLSRKQNEEAIRGFRAYIKKYPQGAFSVNAYYWLGELYWKKKALRDAEEAFQHVLRQYPSSSEVPNAQLRVAMIHLSLGQREQARREFQKIKQHYPGRIAAQLASLQLQRM